MDKLLQCQKQLKALQEEHDALKTQLDKKEIDVSYAQNHDSVTNVLNTNALIEKLIKNKNRCYILLNIDNFQNMNFVYGYEYGTELLKKIVKLLYIVKPADFELYRFYADKFVFMSEKQKDEHQIRENVESIISFFNAIDMMANDTIPINLSFSIGISTAVGFTAITEAELAVKEIRKSRRNYYYIYNQELQSIELEEETVYWIDKIKTSIFEEEVIVHYQPIINNKTMKIEKYECLSRIEDKGKMVSPYKFLRAASETGVQHLLTQSVIKQSCKKFSDTKLEFSINITKYDLSMEYLEEFLLKHCSKFQIDPSRVVLEILEDISSLNEKNILAQLESLRIQGFQIAVDDFGAQQSNFSRLLEFRPDYLKIDGVFIKNILEDKNSRLITESIVDICKKSGIKVIAEYVHNQEIFNIITKMGIEYSQGYYIGVPSTELVDDSISRN